MRHIWPRSRSRAMECERMRPRVPVRVPGEGELGRKPSRPYPPAEASSLTRLVRGGGDELMGSASRVRDASRWLPGRALPSPSPAAGHESVLRKVPLGCW